MLKSQLMRVGGWEVSQTEKGEKPRVELQLYKGDKNIPSHILDLWIDVVGNQ